ncbi:hypothetical protein Tco_1062619, partial [Tanacetum coccineum]
PDEAKEKKDDDGDADDEDEDDDHIMHKDVDEDMHDAKTNKFGNEEGEMHMEDDAQKETAKEDKGDEGLQATIKPVTLKEMPVNPLKSSGQSINSMMDVLVPQDTPCLQSPSVLIVLVSVIFEPKILSPIPEIRTESPVTTTLPPPPIISTIAIVQQTTTPIPTPPITTKALPVTTIVPKSDTLFIVQLRVTKLEKDVSELKKIDHSAKALTSLKSQVPMVIDNYLGSKLNDSLYKVLQRHTTDLIQKHLVKLAPETNKIQTPTIDLKQESEKCASEIRKIKKERAEKQKMLKNPANHALYHNLMKALIEDENAMDKGVADIVKNHKRQHDDDGDDDEDLSAGPNQDKKTKRRRTKESGSSKKPSTTKETSKGKAPTKSSKSGKSTTTKEPIEELIVEVVMHDLENTTKEDVVNDPAQLENDATPKTTKSSNDTWFTQPPRPPTPDPE